MSKDTKLFRMAGASTFRGKRTFRFCNNVKVSDRVKILERYDHIDIMFVELPQLMNKADATDHLKSLGITDAVMPKTGRGSGLTPEEIEAHHKLKIDRVETEKAAVEAVKNADEEFLDQLGSE